MARVRLQINATAAEEQLTLVMMRKMEAAALTVEAEAIRLVSRGQPVKRVGSRLVGLDPSRPGEPPKVLYGQLRRGMTHSVTRDHMGTRVRAEVGSTVKYARRLELGFVGTDSRGRNVSFAARPYLRPALANAWPRILSIFSRA